MNKTVLLSMFLLIAGNTKAQDVLRLEDAMSIALKNNFDILIEKNTADIAKNNVYLGNAGILPQVTLNASELKGTSSYNYQQLSSGQVIEKRGAENLNTNAAIQLSWTLFDGLRMFATYNKLQTLDEAERIRLKMQVETTLSSVMLDYYNVLKQALLVTAIDTALKISEQRVRIAQLKYDIGSGSKLELLQAKVDMNAEKAQFLQQKQLLNESKSSLNLLLGRDPFSDFAINDSINIAYRPKYDELKTTTSSRNTNLQLGLLNQKIATYSFREVKSGLYPRVAFSSSYLFSDSKNQSGFILQNNTLGYNYGLTASFNLFNGFKMHHDIQNARLNVSTADIQLKQQMAIVDEALMRLFHRFESNLEILKMETENMVLAKENVSAALLRYKLGNLSAFDLEQAQKSFLDAEYRLVAIQYDTKASEINLLKLNGALVKE